MTRKFLLWLMLILQASFILCFWLLLQVNSNNNSVAEGLSTAHMFSAIPHDSSRRMTNNTAPRVNFIRTRNAAHSAVTDSGKREWLGRGSQADTWRTTESDFAKDFYVHARNARLKQFTLSAPLPAGLKRNNANRLWCFREGTVNETGRPSDSCSCQPEWHGKDCGQPEVIWRSLMTAKQPFTLLDPSAMTAPPLPHRLFLLMEGSFLSDELLELQLQTLADVVDAFVVFMRYAAAPVQQLRAVERRLAASLPNGNYIVVHCTNATQLARRLVSVRGNCTSARAYAAFRAHIRLRRQPTASDLLLYTEQEYALISRQALTFLKYYAGADMPLLRFRLKYIVYGFFWQHPQRTHLSGMLCTFAHLHDPQLGNGDPQQLLRLAGRQETLVIGDLNHYGGWYCLHCQQPDEIIADLHARSSPIADASATLPRYNGGHIDVAYVQKLIASGVLLDDGRTQLQRMRRQAERHFAPPYAEQHGWKFGHLLINLYETLDEEDDDVGASAY